MKPYQNFSLEPMSVIWEGIEYTEEWMPIHGFEEYYSVSTFGRFLSHRENKIMRQHINDKGYLIVSLKGKTRDDQFKFKAHRLVGINFIPNPLIKPQINHDNFDKLNNFFKNLQWVTGKENTQHYYRSQPPRKPQKEKVGEFPIKCKKVVDTATGCVYDTVFLLAEELGLTAKHLRKMLSREIPNKTTYEWLPGQYTLFYKKRHDNAMARYKELRPRIYGVAI